MNSARNLLVILAISGTSYGGVPAGFTMTELVSGLTRPTTLQALPDGRFLIGEQFTGQIKVYKDGSILSTPYATVSPLYTGHNESGLLSLCLDPDFSSNGYVYAFVTHDAATSRIWRFTTAQDVGTNQTLIVSDIPHRGKRHNGGGIGFGPDGKLYIAVGEAGDTSWAQDVNILGGKILRANPDGSVPADNPFGNLVWSYGHRNPFRLTFQPGTGRLYVTENGPSGDDELNRIVKGGNYGWPDDTGPNSNPSYIDPTHNYSSTVVPTDLLFYQGSVMPFDGQLFIVHWRKDSIPRFTLSSSGDSVVSGPTDFVDRGVDQPVDIEQGIDGALYFTTLTGKLYKVEPEGASNQGPTASFTATPNSGLAPLLVNVDASSSVDPDGTIVSFSWNWGDGTPDGSGEMASHVYDQIGTYSLVLTVEDNEGVTGTASDTIAANPPGSGPPSAHVEVVAPDFNGVAPFTVQIEGHGHDPDEDLLDHLWDFGDGSTTVTFPDVPSDTNSTVTHTYFLPGVHSLALTVTDPSGLSDVQEVDITVYPSPPENLRTVP